MAVPKRARQRLELVAIAAVALAAAFVQHPPGDNQTAHLALVKAIADGTPRIDRYQDETADDSYIDGHFYTAKAPGLALFTEPWYLVLRATNLDVANPAAGAGSLGFLAALPFALVALPEFALHTKWSLPAALAGIALVTTALWLPARPPRHAT